jgi:hypothetical protein
VDRTDPRVTEIRLCARARWARSCPRSDYVRASGPSWRSSPPASRTHRA